MSRTVVDETLNGVVTICEKMTKTLMASTSAIWHWS